MRAEDSSSPSANPLVVSFTPRGTGGERWELHLSDGSSFFVSTESLQLAEVAAHELAPGTELERRRAERLLDCSRGLDARSKALELLLRRSHSVRELRLKLTQRKFAPVHIDRALAWLGERGYLDDRSFAREWAERRLARHPEGQPALVAGLRRHGVSREIAEEVAAGMCSGESERAAARAVLDRLVRRDDRGWGDTGDTSERGTDGDAGVLGRAEVERLRRALRRRGFSSALILELLPGGRSRGGGGECGG